MNQQGITFSSLKSQLSKHDGLLENLTIRSAAEKNLYNFILFLLSASTDGWFLRSHKKLSKLVRLPKLRYYFHTKDSHASCSFSKILKLKISRTSVPLCPASSRSRTCVTTRSSSASTSSSPSSTSASSPGGQSLKSIFYEKISKSN